MQKELVINAINSKKPIFYKVTIEGKATLYPFVNDACKKYYINLLKSTQINVNFSNLPVKVVAFNIVGNIISCIVSTYDQFEESIYLYFQSINEEYSKNYYAKVYASVGYLFKEVIKVKKIGKMGELLDGIVSTHKLSEIKGLGDYRLYPFSSYKKALTTDTEVDMSDMAYLVKNLDRKSFENIHEDRDFIYDPIYDYTAKDESLYFEELLNRYKTKTKKYRNEIIVDMFIDYYAETGCSFDTFSLKFKMDNLTKREFYPDIARILFDKKYDFFAISQIIGEQSNVLLFELIYEINKTKGYGLFYILEQLNIAFNNDFANEFINYICETTEETPQSLASKLSITL